MRIVINGWFSDQLATGSGQYLAALTEWLPRVGGEHEFVVVRTTGDGRPVTNDERRTTDDGRRVTNDERRTTNDRRPATADDTHHAPRTTHHAPRTTHSALRTPHSAIPRPLAKLWFEQIAFPLACRRLRADVAFVPYWAAPLWSPCPVVVTVHDLIPLLLPLYRGGLLQRAYTALVSLTARRAAAVLTDSEASKADIVAHLHIPAGRVHAIHLATDPRFRPVTDPAALAAVRARYGLPDEPFLLYLGGFDVRKNVGRMIEAYARMADGKSQIANRKSQIANEGQALPPDPCLLPPAPCPKLVIAGKLPERDTAFAPDPQRVAQQLGIADRVWFTGWVNEADKPALYSLALGVVFVSEYEGFGLPALEAMACGPTV